ncbi:hypothetical protein LPB67_02760 [Undibacterium sp. Jales W-56]|uniref:hypothetical protein n=1 Tax=Undibacterium sp. Jales W-56 TaxID=2897325 RepID=UPI0021D34C1A|nr:hypothetical protein [Undibacterium sp. Jales W-56]MCU6432697.1 hypothetical protein [Undibacterium sp. Jales W-56]
MSAMYPKPISRQPHRLALPAKALCAQGFSLVAAIFLLVILSALGTFMLSLSTMEQANSTQDLFGSKAYQAAKAGIEWGTYQIMYPENTNPASGSFTTQYACPATPANITTLAGGLNKFTVKVQCQSTSLPEGGNLITVYQITSTATFGTAPAVNSVERQIAATVNTCRKVANGASC